MIPIPNDDRQEVIQQIFDGLVEPTELTDWEIAWLQDVVMQSMIDELCQTNPLVFSEVEDGLIN